MVKKSIYGQHHTIIAKGEIKLKNGKLKKTVFSETLNDWMLKSDFRITEEEYSALPNKI